VSFFFRERIALDVASDLWLEIKSEVGNIMNYVRQLKDNNLRLNNI